MFNELEKEYIKINAASNPQRAPDAPTAGPVPRYIQKTRVPTCQ